MEVLRELDKWSWDGYQERLAAKGYDLYLRKDKKDVIRGYVLLKGNTKFKASELGKGRNLTASRIRQTWEKLHQGKGATSPSGNQTACCSDIEAVHSHWYATKATACYIPK